MTIPLLEDVVIILGLALGGGLQVVLTGVAAWAQARILVRVLRQYLIPQVEIEEVVGDVQSRGYELFREMAMDRGVDPGELHQHIPDPKVATVKVCEESYLVGRTFQEVALREAFPTPDPTSASNPEASSWYSEACGGWPMRRLWPEAPNPGRVPEPGWPETPATPHPAR